MTTLLNNIDKELLKNCCKIQSSYVEDTEINDFVKSYITSLNLEYSEDNFGNIYVTKGNGENGYKCIVSHTDTVHSIKQDRDVFEHNGFLYAMCLNTTTNIISQCGVGGDDKVGVYMCLKALTDFDNIKVVFFRFEESGRKGSRACDIDFFKDCNLIAQPDRKGNTDFIRTSAGVEMCSDEFVQECEKHFSKFSYKAERGIATDVDVLKERGVDCCCFNISCGYYHPHTDTEVICLEDVEVCYQIISDIFNNMGDTKWEHTYTPTKSVYGTYTGYSGKSYSFSNTIGKTLLDEELENSLFLTKYNPAESKYNDLVESGYEKFWANFNYDYLFYYIGDNVIKVNEDVVYLHEEDIFYDINENSYIITTDEVDKLYKEMVIVDNNVEFVYSHYYSAWLLKENSVWNEKEGCYKPRVFNIE